MTVPVLISIRRFQLTNVWFISLESPLAFCPIERKQASLHLCFHFLPSVAYWNTICACSMSLFCQQNTHSLNDIFNPLYHTLMSIYIDIQTFSFHHWRRNDIFVPNYYCDNVMQSPSRQTPLLPATAQNFLMIVFGF